MLFFVIGLFLFCRGFLFTRFTIDDINTAHTNHSSHGLPQQKAIIVILDALRFDFTVTQSWTKRGLLFRSKADPPTTTQQRLEAMLTGSLPTFIDLSMNFANNKITIDSIINQLAANNKRIHFMGDDTWLNLFNNSLFAKANPFPSFEVWDLHSVDLGIVDLLYDQVRRKDWDVIVAHFLGIDHAGHRYGPDHIEMKKKLVEVNGWMNRLLDSIDDDTIVYILGDHGMDEKGDHGGEGLLETDTTTFVYSKSQILPTDPLILRFWDIVKGRIATQFPEDSGFVQFQGVRSISQIDFVPSFSLMAGVSIPYANLGSIIPELFLHNTSSSTDDRYKFRRLIEATRTNSLQIYTYLKKYSEFSGDLDFDKLSTLYAKAEQSHTISLEKGMDPATTTQQIVELSAEVFVKHTLFQRTCLTSARLVWAKFNTNLIILGLMILGLSFLFQFQHTHFNHLSLAIASIIAFLSYSFANSIPDTSASQTSLFLFSAAYIISSLTISPLSLPKVPSYNQIIPITAAALHILVPASDSFTYWEDWVTFYILQTLALGHLISRHQSGKGVDIAVYFLILTRITHLSSICRGEQASNCTPSFYEQGTGTSVAALYTLPLLAITQLAIWRVISRVTRDNLRGGWVRIFTSAVVPIGLVTAVAHTIIETCDAHGILTFTAFFKVPIARVGFGIFGVCAVACLALDNPVCAKHSTLGFGHASGKVYLLFTSIYIVVLAVQKPVGGIMLAICFLRVHCLMYMKPEESAGSLMFYLTGLHTFFATGHQTVFSCLQMDTGFFGLNRVNWILTPLFIFLNTFGAFVICGLGLVMYSTLRHQNSKRLFAVFEGIAIVSVCASAVMTAHFRRHLMVWGVFAPRFIFAAMWGCVSLATLCAGRFILEGFRGRFGKGDRRL